MRDVQRIDDFVRCSGFEQPFGWAANLEGCKGRQRRLSLRRATA